MSNMAGALACRKGDAMSATDKLSKLVSDVQDELKNAKAELTATQVKINALRQTEAELKERVGDAVKNLQLKEQLEVLQAKAKKLFANELG
jgi:predicted  nucleic acid-binding Zn-ribbon protein